MAEEICRTCGEAILDSDTPIYHDACDHYSHAKCDEGLMDECPQCRNSKKIAAIRDDSSTRPPERGERVLKPENPSRFAGVMTWINEKSAPIRNRKMTPETSRDPFYLMQTGQPIADFLSKGISVSGMKESGIGIGHFLKNGYNLRKIRGFSEFDDQKEGILRLIDFGLTANMIVTNKGLLPIEELKEDCGLTPRIVVENLGVGFDDIRGLIGPGCAWNLEDAMYLGLDTKEELKNAGLATVSQWLRLEASPGQLYDLKWKEEDTSELFNDIEEDMLHPIHDNSMIPVNAGYPNEGFMYEGVERDQFAYEAYEMQPLAYRNYVPETYALDGKPRGLPDNLNDPYEETFDVIPYERNQRYQESPKPPMETEAGRRRRRMMMLGKLGK